MYLRQSPLSGRSRREVTYMYAILDSGQLVSIGLKDFPDFYNIKYGVANMERLQNDRFLLSKHHLAYETIFAMEKTSCLGQDNVH